MGKTFRTTFEIKPFTSGVGYSSPTLLLGSCFAQSIGNMLNIRKFPALTNPFGVIYNPKSVSMALHRIASGEVMNEENLHFHNNLWFSFYHHTSFSSPSKTECLNRINSSIRAAYQQWQCIDFLIITFGTARVYSLKEGNMPVANCHKLPDSAFYHRLLSVEDIVGDWQQQIDGMIRSKPSIRIIFSVSPIRHWKDGAVGNQVSKSTLLLAVNELVKLFPRNTVYFPAYEIMMDDLRDYRFYADDMLHPSDLAIEYIWERFSESAFAPSTKETAEKVMAIVRATNHRPLRPNSEEFRKFCWDTLSKIDTLEREHPSIDFTLEKEKLNQFLHA